MLDRNSIYLGDCLDVMKDIDDESIDMILCDLPYGTTTCYWDTIIPFDLLWEQYKRIIKKNGAIVLTSTQPFTSKLIMSNIAMYKYCWIWEKSRAVGFVNAKLKPMNKHEDIVVFSKGKTSNGNKNNMCYYPQGLKKVEIYKGPRNEKTRGRDGGGYGRPSLDNGHIQEHTNYPTSIIRFNSVSGGIHPTQKPVDLFEYLIKTYTTEGETVLDNCAGSGTTGVACQNTNRHYILIEREERYYEMTKKRLEDNQNQSFNAFFGG